MRVVSNVFRNCHFQVRDYINLFYQLVQQEFFKLYLKFLTKSSFLDFSQKIQEIKKEEFFCKNNIVENSLYLALLKSLIRYSQGEKDLFPSCKQNKTPKRKMFKLRLLGFPFAIFNNIFTN